MSNTYFAINTVDKVSGVEKDQSYTNEMRLSLTKFVSKEKGLQITCQTNSTLKGQSGIGYCTLSKKQALQLRNAITEFLVDEISATGYEVSKYTDKDDNLG